MTLVSENDSGSSGQEYQNPPDTTYVRFIGIVCAIVAIFGTMIGLLSDWPAYGYLLPWGIACAFQALIWWREYYHRPKTVTVKGDGIVMKFRYAGSRFVLYERIIGVGLRPGDSHNPIEGWDRNGAIILDRGVPYQLTYDIALAIRQGYKEKLGRMPSVWDDYTSPRQFRKRIGT